MAAVTPWWERPGNPRAYGTSCLFHPLEEAINVSPSNVPRCGACLARLRMDRDERGARRLVQGPPREMRPQLGIALTMARLEGAVLDWSRPGHHVLVEPVQEEP